MWFDSAKTALTKLKVAYNNYSLRQFMGLRWHNSASEMFVTLNIKSFGELLRISFTVFVQGLLHLGILCCQVFTIVQVVFIQSYMLGCEHYSMFIRDWPHSYIL